MGIFAYVFWRRKTNLQNFRSKKSRVFRIRNSSVLIICWLGKCPGSSIFLFFSIKHINPTDPNLEANITNIIDQIGGFEPTTMISAFITSSSSTGMSSPPSSPRHAATHADTSVLANSSMVATKKAKHGTGRETKPSEDYSGGAQSVLSTWRSVCTIIGLREFVLDLEKLTMMFK